MNVLLKAPFALNWWRGIRKIPQKQLVGQPISTSAPIFKLHSLYHLSEEEQLTQNAASRFAKGTILPYVKQMDEEGKVHPDVLKGLFDTGLMGVEIPEEYGGSGGNFFSALLIIEEIGKVCMGIGVLVDAHILVQNMFKTYGTPEQKRKYIPRLVAGSVGSFGMSESGSGSDAFALCTTAKRDGEWWYINGSKQYISNALEPGFVVVMANTRPEKGYRGITSFIVDKDAMGVEIGLPEKKMGIRACSTCSINFDNVKVHGSAILGQEGEGYKIAIQTLNLSRIGIAALCTGVAEGAFRSAVEYTKERQQFGRKVFSFQSIQHQIAHARSQIEAARMLTYNAARLGEEGHPVLKEASMAKYMASEAAVDICTKSIDWMGGAGFMENYYVEKYYRDIKAGTIIDGTTNIQLNTIGNAIEKEGF